MKSLIKIITVVLLVSFFVSLLASPAAFAKNDNAKESLVAVGDSIPFGYNLGQTNQNPAKASYPYLIGKLSDLRVRNLGVPGWQSDQLLTAVETSQKYRQAVNHSDYVAVTIGSNDLLEILRAAAAESGGDQILFQQLLQQKLNDSDVFSNIEETVREIRSLTDSPIVLYNVYNPFQLSDPFHHVADAFLPQVNAAFTGLAFSYDDVYLGDAYGAFGSDQATYVLPGDIHPTEAGQAKLAEIGLEAFGLY
ncbi:SGNH/GDSL hydrolase family protein [Alkalicoccus halolimnae]|uniref:GDSL-type esterase/lipase family protein n=1 Tax=Alkalicoccus halolimnae TaxID=1667239 RepID=A0A5C7F649_9BACI|nr:GDSL-type esterase/lipase family protein [Alkalicoccus halolimnae]TXF86201.1 lipolytic protein G-D-S-L family [Alkalicoccus halolimnae]